MTEGRHISEGRQRKSARLLALEEQNSEKAILALPVNLQQMKADGHLNSRKRGRKKETRISQDIDENINGNSIETPPTSRNASDRIICYILDMLEVKDTHELFSMPDNLQMYDYNESMNKPGDFATLRQKQTDGMYMTLEQFENDVFKVFQKAMDSNTPNSIPFREAISIRDHARQIFQSLKNNLPYAELELSTWHQRYFNYKRRPQRTVANVRTSSDLPPPKYNSHLVVPTGTIRNTGGINIAACGRQYSMRISRDSQPTDSSNTSGKRGYYHPAAASRDNIRPRSLEEQQRYIAHKPWSDSNELLFTTFSREPKPFRSNALSYQESLRQFVKDAGPVAKQIGERKCLEYSKRVQAQSIWRPSPFGSQSKIGDQPFCSSSTPPQCFRGSSSTSKCSSFNTDSTSTTCDKVEKTTTCQLQTDELLNLFSLIGTPEFLQRSMKSSTVQDVDSEWGFKSFLQGTGATQSSVGSTKQTGQFSSLKFRVPKSPTIDRSSIWQPRFGGSKPWKESSG